MLFYLFTVLFHQVLHVWSEFCYDSGSTSDKSFVLISAVTGSNNSIQAYDVQHKKLLSEVPLSKVNSSEHNVSFWWDKSDVIKVLATNQKMNCDNHLFKFDLNGQLVSKCSFRHGHMDDRYLFSKDGVTTCHGNNSSVTRSCTLYHYFELENKRSGGRMKSCSENPIEESYIVKADQVNAHIMDSTDDHHCFVHVKVNKAKKKENVAQVTKTCLQNDGSPKGDDNVILDNHAEKSHQFDTLTIGKQPYVSESKSSQMIRIYRIDFKLKEATAFAILHKNVKFFKSADRLLMMSFKQKIVISDPFDETWPTINLGAVSNDLQPIVILRKCQEEKLSTSDVGVVVGAVCGAITICIAIVVVAVWVVYKRRRKAVVTKKAIKLELYDPKVVSVRQITSPCDSVAGHTQKRTLDTVSTQGYTASISHQRRHNNERPRAKKLSDGSTIRKSIGLQDYDTMPTMRELHGGTKTGTTSSSLY